MFTKEEQKTFEAMFDDLIPYPCVDTDKEFLNNLGDVVFNMTGNVNLRMKIFNIAEKIPTLELVEQQSRD